MDNLDRLSDAELVEKSLENPDFFIYIIRRFSSRLSRYIKRRSKATDTDTDDILQEVFIKVYKNLNDYNKEMAFSSWIYRITHNHIIDWYRRENKRAYVSIDDIDTGVILNLSGGEFADRTSIQNEIKDEMSKIIEELSGDYKDIILLRFFEDKSYEEISDIMKIPTSNVGVKINRAKEIIRKKLLEVEKQNTKTKLT